MVAILAFETYRPFYAPEFMTSQAPKQGEPRL